MDNIMVHKDLIARLGFTTNQVLHVCATQLADLVLESEKRIRYSPFDRLGSYVGHSGGKDSVLVRWLVDRTWGQVEGPEIPTIHTPKPMGVRNEVHPLTREFLYAMRRPILYLPDGSAFSKFGLKTQIDGTRASEAERRDGRDVGLVIRGEERSRTDTPLYLEDGLFGQQYVYPIFDWSDLQVWSAILYYGIPFSDEYYVIES